MEPGTVSPFAAWESFYVIIGSAAAALTGLQFVVIVLGAELRALRNDSATKAFGTPTVVHFCMVLLVAAVLSAPWRTFAGPRIALAICGIGGVLYVARVVLHARAQRSYSPETSDWVWYFAIPAICYAALAGAGVYLGTHPPTCLFVIGGVALALVFIGIHNAWDTVTYIGIDSQRTKSATTIPATDPSPSTVQENA